MEEPEGRPAANGRPAGLHRCQRPEEARVEGEGRRSEKFDSRYYIVQPTNEEFCDGLENQDAIMLIKGARQMGKTLCWAAVCR